MLAGATPVLVHNCNEVPDTLYHYTTEDGMNGIRESGELWPSTKAARPTDAKYGDGQYFTDVKPGTKRPGQLARALHGTPWGGQRYSHYVAIDVRGLGVVKAPDREGVFVLNGGVLDVSNRIVGHGRGPIGP
ncbi:HYD1 signature containing ADP-ribosyltransferase family protein [Streptomyces sp. NPDC096310]|uniref:HYD1 signature containing ADP-ribosyltransferase family protein n=1 Tax=Streptomyces sp. NPDC096310 TaxID=3366082 RepID=UPI00380A33C2